jgi:hypothetical protein
MELKMYKKILITTLSILSVSVYAATYEVVIDAGSTGNRVYVYKQSEGNNAIPDITVQNLDKIKDKDGNKIKIKNKNDLPLAGNDVNQTIKPLLDLAKAYLQNKNVEINTVPVSVLATAGMRVLANENESKVIAKYAEVQAIIESAGFKVNSVRTILGTDEGLYSWLDINYNNLKEAKPTKGIIEVGGASAQIAFNTSDNQNVSQFTAPSQATITKFQLNGKIYNVFSISYLGLGQNMARKMMNMHNSNMPMNKNSCYVGNYINKAQPLLFPNSIFPNSTFASADTSFRVESNNIFDFDACSKNYQTILSMADYASLFQIRSVENFASTDFLGLASIYWRFQEFGVQSFDLANLKTNILKVCKSITIDPSNINSCEKEVQTDVEKAMCKKQLEPVENCANATYLYQFLEAANSNQEHLKGDYNAAVDGTWTKGYVLYNNISKSTN